MAANTIRKKLVFVGDGACGKTWLVRTLVDGKCPDTLITRILEINTVDIVVDGKDIELGLWDTAGQEDYDRARPLSYPDTNAVVIVFAIDSPDSLEFVQEKWVPEVQHFCPGCPIVLVGCKADLRYDPATIREFKKQGEHPVTDEEALAVAAKIGAVEYVSCSATTGFNVKEVFEVAARVALLGSKQYALDAQRLLEQLQAVHNDKKETLVKKAKAMARPGKLDRDAIDALCLRLRKHESKHTAAAWITALDQLEPACIVPELIASCVAKTLRDEYQTATRNGATAAEAAVCLKSHVEAVLCEPLQQLVDLDDPKRRAKELSSLTSKLLLPDWWYPAAVVKPMETV
jgi:Ras family protein A